MNKSRYKRIKQKDGTTRDEHRLVMERHLGRNLSPDELVHHINGDRRDNRLDNLKLNKRKGRNMREFDYPSTLLWRQMVKRSEQRKRDRYYSGWKKYLLEKEKR